MNPGTLAGLTLITSIGWKPHLVTDVCDRLQPDHVILIHTTHPRTLACAAKLRGKLPDDAEFIAVNDNFNFVDWYRAIDAAAAQLKGEVYVNLTAGHAITIANLSIIAERRRIPCVCWDDDKKELHHMVPSTLPALAELGDVDRSLLKRLCKGPANVGTLVEDIDAPQSTVSMALGRLTQLGFTQAEKVGRNRVYSLRPGVELAA